LIVREKGFDEFALSLVIFRRSFIEEKVATHDALHDLSNNGINI